MMLCEALAERKADPWLVFSGLAFSAENSLSITLVNFVNIFSF